jgi:hypothetical protein
MIVVELKLSLPLGILPPVPTSFPGAFFWVFGIPECQDFEKDLITADRFATSILNLASGPASRLDIAHGLAFTEC